MRYFVRLIVSAEMSVVVTVSDTATDSEITKAAMDEARNWKLEDVDMEDVDVFHWVPIRNLAAANGDEH